MIPRIRPSLGLVAALATGLGAQTPAVSQQPAFRTGIDVVTVDAFVTDRQGRPVRDLTAADFEIKERGKVQTIDSFKLVAPDDEFEAAPSSLREIESREDQAREAARDDIRLIVIFLDDYHVQRMNGLAMRDRLAAFVNQISARDLVAIMRPLTPVTGLTFSRNREAQQREISRFIGRKYDYFSANAPEENYQGCSAATIERIRWGVTSSALRGLTTYLGALRERRSNVLFVSEGPELGPLPKRVTETAGTGRCAADAMLESDAGKTGRNWLESTAIETNTAVYTLDTRGLGSEDFDMRDSPAEVIAGRKRVAGSQEFLRNLSFQTGGRAFVNTNDFERLLPQMLRDTGAYYLIGYTSTEAFRDGQFHAIDVRVKRKNVDVRARQGYFARGR